MTLIKSISGIRGTIGGVPKENLTPPDIVAFSSAFAAFVIKNHGANPLVIIGRDARISGQMVSNLVGSTLSSMGVNVIDLGLSTTPSVEMAVPHFKASGGIIITASHNPEQWNALKLLNRKGEFISAAEGEQLVELAEQGSFEYQEVDKLGTIKKHSGGFISEHIDKILQLDWVKKERIESASLKIVIDPVNSTGALAIPPLLDKLGIKNYTVINDEANGRFNHNPEPLKEHLHEISAKIKESGADLGIVVDPDVDRLALVCEDGSMFGEEYTLVAVADYMLSKRIGNTVSNLSSSRALRDITEKHGGSYSASAVGEVNVVEMMKSTQALIGGEGNGGIILPELHYGRDALAGIALFLSYYVEKELSMTKLRNELPQYYMSKNKLQLNHSINTDEVLSKVKELYAQEKIDTTDGVKIDMADGWIHLRKSNTEPIIRIYTEANSVDQAEQLAKDLKEKVQPLLQ